MKKKVIRCLLLSMSLIVISFNNFHTTAYSQQVQSVETESSIGFTGVYEPIGTPDPAPPENIAKPPNGGGTSPGGSLPQTNEQTSTWVSWLGLSMIVLFVVLWKRKKKETQ